MADEKIPRLVPGDIIVRAEDGARFMVITEGPTDTTDRTVSVRYLPEGRWPMPAAGDPSPDRTGST